jgi:hypothetical protein
VSSRNKKSAAFAVALLAFAISVGVATPASAVSMSADNDEIYTGGSATWTTDAPYFTLMAIYVGNERVEYGPLWDPVTTIEWVTYRPCENVDVEIRVYDELYISANEHQNLSIEDAYAASDIVEFLGNQTYPDCISYGAGDPITLESTSTSVSFNNPSFTLTSNGEDLAKGLIFVNGEQENAFQLSQLNGQVTNWYQFAPCTTIDVEYRIYNSLIFGDPNPSYTDPFDAGVLIEFVGDDTYVGCNTSWDEQDGGSGEPLANTGSDASAVAGLTGVAGVAALAVAAAVAFRSRRAQR